MKSKTFNRPKKSEAIPSLLVSGLMIAVLVSPSISFAAQKEKENDKDNRGHAYGQLIAPGFIKNFGEYNRDLSWLPFGISKKISLKDFTDPDFETIDIENVAVSTASIFVKTDEPTKAKLYVSTEENFKLDEASITEVKNMFMTEHIFELETLNSNTTYFYKVMVEDAAGNKELSQEMSFMTEDEVLVDEVAPTISNIVVENSDSTIKVNWDTNEEADGELYLSTINPVDPDALETIVVDENSLDITHTLEATELTANTTYYGYVASTDGAGNTVISATFEVTTDILAPVLTDIGVVATTDTAMFTWTTNEDSTSAVYLSTNESFNLDDTDTISMENLSLTSEHSLEMTNLMPNTTYYFAISSVDAADNYSLSTIASFTTDKLPDVTGPIIMNVSGVASVNEITGSWKTDEPATSAIYTSTASGFALDDANVLITEDTSLTTDHQLTIDGLTTGTTYYHRIVTEDEFGNKTVSIEYVLGTL